MGGNTPQDQLQNWKTHFKELLGRPPLPSDDQTHTIISKQLPIEMGDFTPTELLASFKSMSNHKSCGLNEIPIESWKTGLLSNVLLLMCHKALKGNVPTAWKQAVIIPLPKKGSLSLPENYRRISLTSVAAKIYNQMILSHIRPHIDPLLQTNQNGFCQGRSTVSKILTLHHGIEEVKEHNLWDSIPNH